MPYAGWYMKVRCFAQQNALQSWNRGYRATLFVVSCRMLEWEEMFFEDYSCPLMTIYH